MKHFKLIATAILLILSVAAMLSAEPLAICSPTTVPGTACIWPTGPYLLTIDMITTEQAFPETRKVAVVFEQLPADTALPHFYYGSSVVASWSLGMNGATCPRSKVVAWTGTGIGIGLCP